MTFRRLAAVAVLTMFAVSLPAAEAASSRAEARGAVAKRKAEPRRAVARASIVGGQQATAEWPWMTAVLTSEALTPDQNDWQRQFCGGVLVTPTAVLTAAHCVINTERRRTAEGVQVLLGRRTLRAAGGEKLDVARIEIHPGYDLESKANDVAVLHLAQASSATPAALLDPERALYEGDRTRLQGWGRTVEGDPSSGAESLLEADLPLWSTARCRASYPELDAGSGFCAGYVDGLIDACQGDSGGPLMIVDGGQWRLLGLVSYGHGCARANYPTVYAWLNATRIRSWVTEQLTPPAAPAPEPVNTPVEAPAPAPVVTDEVAPAILRLSLAARRFRTRRGTWIRTQLSEAATLHFALVRRGRAVRAQVQAGAGAGRFRLSARRLRPGRYTLAVVAVDAAGNRSMTEYVRLRVAR